MVNKKEKRNDFFINSIVSDYPSLDPFLIEFNYCKIFSKPNLNYPLVFALYFQPFIISASFNHLLAAIVNIGRLLNLWRISGIDIKRQKGNDSREIYIGILRQVFDLDISFSFIHSFISFDRYSGLIGKIQIQKLDKFLETFFNHLRAALRNLNEFSLQPLRWTKKKRKIVYWRSWFRGWSRFRYTRFRCPSLVDVLSLLHTARLNKQIETRRY